MSWLWGFSEVLARCLLLLLGIVVLAACQSGGESQPASPSPQPTQDTTKGQNMTEDPIQLKLKVEPKEFSMPERQRFKISLTATNQGKETIDPELHLAQLLINNKASRQWNLAIGNGRREEKWFALPPGDTVSMSWSSLGPSLFPTPGEYTLVLRYHDKKLDPIHVRVRGE
jgi:hypothetical protein